MIWRFDDDDGDGDDDDDYGDGADDNDNDDDDDIFESATCVQSAQPISLSERPRGKLELKIIKKNYRKTWTPNNKIKLEENLNSK